MKAIVRITLLIHLIGFAAICAFVLPAAAEAPAQDDHSSPGQILSVSEQILESDPPQEENLRWMIAEEKRPEGQETPQNSSPEQNPTLTEEEDEVDRIADPLRPWNAAMF